MSRIKTEVTKLLGQTFSGPPEGNVEFLLRHGIQMTINALQKRRIELLCSDRVYAQQIGALEDAFYVITKLLEEE